MRKILLHWLSIVLICISFKSVAQTTTYSYTGAVQTYTVPAGVTAISVDIRGAKGGGTACYSTYQSIGGCGGRVQATINVTPGHVLNITVGGIGLGPSPGTGGFGGGGSDPVWSAAWPGAGGGGGTTIYDVTSGTTLAVAGGGGGGGGDICSGGTGDQGGVGGGLTGGAGTSFACGAGLGGQGGTPTTGGAGSTCGGTGGSGSAGVGGSCTSGLGSGGGGGGWFGGGSGSDGAGGGGGSSYTNATYTTSVIHTQGYNCAAGTAIITVACSAGTITGTASVCLGSTTCLTDATAGGTWSSSNTAVGTVSPSGCVTSITTGTTIISYIMPAGCYATSVVTVNPQPTAITGTAVVCQGLTTSLTDATGVGTWTSSNTGVATVGSTTGVVTGAGGGTSTITYIITSTGCYTVTTVTVNPTPAPITGTLNVCVGLTTPLTDATGGGTWTSTGTATVVATTGVVTGVSAGTATITYTLSTGCIQTAIVTVNALPTAILGTLTVCSGLTTTLSDAGGGTWSSSATGIASVGATTGIVTGGVVATTSTATITYSLATGCISTAIVTVNPLPGAILGTLSVCSGLTTTLSDAGGGTWSSSATGIASVGSTTGIVTGGVVATTSTATITYTLSTGCIMTAVVTVNPLPTAILGTMTVCQGLTTTLTDAAGGGTWSSTGTATVVPTTGVVTGVSVGTATITYTLATGCIITTVVTVNPLPTAILGTLSVCSGLTTTLSDAGGGTWSSSATGIASIGSTTGIVTGGVVATTSTATITYTIGTGCTTTAVVTVNPLPTAILGTMTVCLGLTTTLTDATGGGTWSSSASGTASVGSATGVVTGASVGTAIITYTLVSTGCIITTVVTVNPLPTPILGTLTVCSGLTTTLSDAGGGTWSSSASGIASVGAGTGIVTGGVVATTSTATITYTLGTGCIITAVVTVNPLPTPILGILTVCSGLTTTLSDAGGGTWSSSATGIASVGLTTGVVTGGVVAVTSTATITYTLPTTCIITAIVTVNPLPTPILGTLSVCMGLTTSLTDATGGGAWSSTGTATVVPTTGVVTGVTVGTATITYTLPTTCIITAIVTVDPLPAVITGTKTVCAGLTTNLFDAAPTGTWSSSNTGVATIGSLTGIVTGGAVLVTSTATITYTIGTGCIITTTVTVNPLPTPILGANAVCLGSTVTLSDAGGGTWSSANSGIASVTVGGGVVTGAGVGVTTITYTLPTSCIITAPMTVNPLPTAITGPNTVCPFTSITLSDGTGGGAWTSSNSGIATVGSLTGVVTGASAGTVNITYTLGTSCYVTYVVTVYAAPSPIITPLGDTTVCPGGYVALTANTGAGLTYQWYVGGTPIGGALSSSYIAIISGSYQVLETNTLGCSTLSIPMLVTIDTPVAAITAGGSITICAGSTVTLNANTGAGFSYQWLLDGVVIAGAVGSSYSASMAGNYSVIVTNATGCSATSNIIAVSINPSPTANVVLSGPLTLCQGSMVIMTADYGADYTYQWYNGAGAIPGETNRSYTATVAGTYYVIVTNSYSCTATSIIMTVVVNPLPNVAITASGSLIFCSGGNVTLSAVAVAGDTYQWFLSGSPIAGATNSSYLATVGGGYRVLVTDPTTGCSDKTHADTIVTVVTTPVVVPVTPASFCWGGSALLTTSVLGAAGTVAYQWYLNGAIIPGATNAVYNAAVPGNYSCQISIPGSCTVTTVAIPVTEFPLPNPVVAFDGTYLYTGTFYVAYQWYKDLVAIPGATTYHTNALGSGNYKVAVTDTNGCQSHSDVYVYTGGATTFIGNTQSAVGSIRIYPNPAQTMVHIESAIQVRAVISSIDGRTILNITAAKDIDITNLADGIYMIMLYDDNGSLLKAEKLVKTAE